PVTITSDFVNPGAIYLTLFGASGHTRTITKIGNDEICASKDGSCIKIIFGNEPASENGYVDALIPWKLKRDEGGFIRFRWPEKLEGRWKLR
ncbi:hypothetical protein AAEH73_21640, partial [Shewanella algae]|uniref:hypothetical protein n=1 Tax=Shewanella algae TaxID=38313 RepID=UPI00313F073C